MCGKCAHSWAITICMYNIHVNVLRSSNFESNHRSVPPDGVSGWRQWRPWTAASITDNSSSSADSAPNDRSHHNRIHLMDIVVQCPLAIEPCRSWNKTSDRQLYICSDDVWMDMARLFHQAYPTAKYKRRCEKNWNKTFVLTKDSATISECDSHTRHTVEHHQWTPKWWRCPLNE